MAGGHAIRVRFPAARMNGVNESRESQLLNFFVRDRRIELLTPVWKTGVIPFN